MSRMRATLVVALVLTLIGLVQVPAVHAQSATSGLVTGTVVDPSNAAVGGATISLKGKEKTESLTTTTNAAGIYTFPTVAPGSYTVSAEAKGFQKSVVTDLEVTVLRAFTVNFTLQLGAATMTVEVKAATGVELETASSTVGSTLSGESLEHLPTYARSATALLFLQPAVQPPDNAYLSRQGINDNIGGQVAGSRSEQSTFLLDGGDVTSDLEGTNNYNSPPDEPQPAPIIPIPQEMTSEFRVGVSSPNATFGRTSGGEMAVMTKSGTNAWHGEGYEYNNNSGFNANSWNNNLAGINRPHEVDNRFGGNVGGPIWKDKVWFFAGYEGRRFYENATGQRIVPLPSLAAGNLTFPDEAGHTITYDLKTAMDCGAAGTGACDPRGIGISPTMTSYYGLYHAATAGPGGLTCGDTFNTGCYLFSAPTPFLEDIGVIRLDWTISKKWTAFVTYHIADARRTGTEQAAVPAAGSASWVSTDPYYPYFYSFEVTGQLTPNLTLVSHGSYLRNWWAWGRSDPGNYGLLSNTNPDVLQLTGEGIGNSNSSSKFIADPINVNTQQARARVWDGRDVYLGEDFSYVRGSHLWQFGVSMYRYDDIHIRTDDVLGGLTNFPIDYIGAAGVNSYGSYNQVGANFEPPACAGAGSANCLPPSQVADWNELYSATLGIVDHVSQIATRTGSFQPNPLGSSLSDNVKIYAPYGYVQDSWKIRPSVTLTLGVNWGAQLNPTEANNKQAIFTSAETGAAINYFQYISARAHILGDGVPYGDVFNPQFALTPAKDVPAPLNDQFKQTVFKDFGPRISIAWNVPYKNWLFGNKQTVIRTGYAMVFDRTTAVAQALNPLLTGGLASVTMCGGPLINATCSGAATDPTTAFRVGVDSKNALPVPATGALPIPYVPPAGSGGLFPTYLTAGLDPYISPAYSHNVNFDIQRSLPWNMVLEVGYIGKFGRDLTQSQSLNDTFYKYKDAASGQTLAQAFQNVAEEVRSGAKITPQPWFENQLANASVTGNSTPCVNAATTLGVGAAANCTQLAVNADTAFFGFPYDFEVGGLANWAFSQGGFGLNTLLPALGLPQMDNQQIELFDTTTGHGYSNYNAFIFSLNKAVSANLQFQFNWTYSKAIGTQGLNQQYLYANSSPYNLALDYAPEVFDHEHTITWWTVYNLPFGKGQRWHSDSNLVNNLIGGWTGSYIFSFFTGLPLSVNCDGDFGTPYFLLGSGTPCDSTINLNNAAGFHDSVGTGTSSAALPPYQNAVGGGTKLNIFGNPAAILNSIVSPNLVTTGQLPWGGFRMIPTWNLDLGLAKSFNITERVKFEVNAQFLNILNHVVFSTPNLDAVFAGASFGEFTNQVNSPRRILLGARITF